MKVLCSVFKSPREEGLYLYVKHGDQLRRVPETLLEKFGTPRRVTTLALTPDRKLARADAGKIIEALQERGFYLQLPPPPGEYMRAVHQKNDKF